MQFGFMPGRGTTDPIFILRQLQEKHLAKNKKLYFAFVDLEKAFDHVPRKVMVGHAKTWHRGMYCAIRAGYVQQHQKQRVNNTYSDEFGVHQGSVLSPLLFVIVLVISAEAEEELKMKLNKWKTVNYYL